MLTRLYVRNYRSIEEMDLELAPLTVLVGPNGAGKSNIIDVLRFVRDALTIGLENAILMRHGMSALRRWSPKGRPHDVHIELSFQFAREEKAVYGFALASMRRGEFRVKWEKLHGERRGETYGYEIKDGRWVQTPYGERSRFDFVADRGHTWLKDMDTSLYMPRVLPFPGLGMAARRFVQNMRFYTIYPNILREPQKPANPYPLEERAQNLASLLRAMRKSKQGQRSFRSLLEALSAAVEGVTDVTVAQVGGYLVTRVHHGVGGPVFPLAQESDGTLRLLGILAALYQWPPRPFLAIEEPELTVHPGALGVLRDVLLEVRQQTQLIITTHSPDLLYGLPVETVRVVEKIDNVTLVGVVSEEQRRAVAQKLFSPGELMRIEGLHRASIETAGEGVDV